jgi:transcriptional regulator with XRE-family HTH domain
MWQRLQTWMNETGTTQAALASRMSVSQPTVSDWLNRKTYPSTENLIRLAEITGISLDELVKGEQCSPGSTLQAAPAA